MKNLKFSWITNIKSAILVALLSVNISYAQQISTVFGVVEEKDPLTLELLNHQAIQRLKHLDQSGPLIYFSNKYPSFSRFDHSLGVYALLKKYNFSQQEQIAGLMHDASHTAFSHLADYILQKKQQHTESYQDNIHDWFLDKMGVKELINKHQLSLADISPKNPNYQGLEQPYPDMNADRIEYNLHTALAFKDITTHEVNQILAALKYDQHKWYFTSQEQALKFAKLSTKYTRTFWGGEHNAVIYAVAGVIIKYALNHNSINTQELHFGNDLEVIEKLEKSDDPIIKELLTILLNIDKYYQVVEKANSDIHIAIKMRGIDPLVDRNGQLQRLSAINRDFKDDLQKTIKHAAKGTSLKFINISNQQVLEILRKTIS